MKKLILFIIFLSTQSFAIDNCEILYSDEYVQFCATENDGEIFLNKPLYSIYAISRLNEQEYLIAQEIDLTGVRGISPYIQGQYTYRAYFGGNSINAENRHILILVNNTSISNAGSFAGIEDLNNNGNLEFYSYSLVSQGSASSNDLYEKKSLTIVDNELIFE